MQERLATPWWQVFDAAFDLSDPDLWRSNSFSSLRPLLILHVKAAVAELEYEITHNLRDSSISLEKLQQFAATDLRARRMVERRSVIPRLRIELRLTFEPADDLPGSLQRSG